MDTLRHILASSSLAMVVFGCFGNCLSAIIFLQRKTSINILLSALAFIDIGLLLFAIPVFILPTLDRWDGFITLESVQAIVVKFLYPVNLMFQTWSIYTIVLITAERWLAICRPLHVRSLCTSRTAKWSLLFTAIFSVLYNIVRFWEYSLSWTPDGSLFFERNLRDPTEHPFYVLWYYSMLFLVTHFLLPFGTIFTLNAVVCHRILRLRSVREQLTMKQRREHSTTTMYKNGLMFSRILWPLYAAAGHCRICPL
uniref:G-protein coupled receptors family 1 profile domain-containing protein n=1 Tax=Globodera rostochiensis TaxID=31243 RepID=A0A914HYU3_GLORO